MRRDTTSKGLAELASRRRDCGFARLAMFLLTILPMAVSAQAVGGAIADPEIRRGRALLQGKQFHQAETLFSGYLRTHAGDVQAELGLGDAQLGLQEYEAAELTYRKAVAQQPELWQAHKNLAVVEAALGRWEDFEGERKILRLARERGAPGISSHESDVIDTLSVNGGRWVVRSYFEPVGRSRALYNFERFSPEGRVEEYVSLEDEAAAREALTPGDVRIGASTPAADSASSYALNWYSGRAHGTITTYHEVPTYQRLRGDVQRWLKHRPRASK